MDETSVNMLPPNLTELDMRCNEIKNQCIINNLPLLKKLNLRSNGEMTYLKIIGSPDLVDLDISHSNISHIPELTNSIKYLYCHSIRSLESFPSLLQFNNLIKIDFDNCDIKIIDLYLPSSLQIINCISNTIDTLHIPKGSSVKELTMSHCNMKHIKGEFPRTLENIDFMRNMLDTIPSLANCVCLKHIDLSDNLLVILPELSFVSLTMLDISNNNFTKDYFPLTDIQITNLARYSGPGEKNKLSYDSDSDDDVYSSYITIQNLNKQRRHTVNHFDIMMQNDYKNPNFIIFDGEETSC